MNTSPVPLPDEVHALREVAQLAVAQADALIRALNTVTP